MALVKKWLKLAKKFPIKGSQLNTLKHNPDIINTNIRGTIKIFEIIEIGTNILK